VRSVGAWRQRVTDRPKSRIKRAKSASLPVDEPMRRLMWRLDRLPRWIGSAGASAFLLVSITYGLVEGGHIREVATELTAAGGFAIRQVRISGQKETQEGDIMAMLALPERASIVTFDTAKARARVAANPWIEEVSVRALLPGTLQVSLRERAPMALWQRGKLVSIIDNHGRVITDYIDERFTSLLLVVGHGAQRGASGLIATLDRFPSLKSRLRAAVLVADRRWNLVMENGIEIKLPEGDLEASLAKLERLDDKHGLLKRDIAAVDLRLDDRLVIKLTDDAAMRRKATIGERMKKKPGAET